MYSDADYNVNTAVQDLLISILILIIYFLDYMNAIFYIFFKNFMQYIQISIQWSGADMVF